MTIIQEPFAATGVDDFADMPDVLAELESGILPPHAFDHRGHVFAAWAAMRLYGVEEGAVRFRHALRRYCEHLEASDKYHVTITDALIRLVAVHLPEAPQPEREWRAQWRRFQQRAGSLLDSSRSALALHYSAGLIDSVEARSRFLAPDLAPLP